MNALCDVTDLIYPETWNQYFFSEIEFLYYFVKYKPQSILDELFQHLDGMGFPEEEHDDKLKFILQMFDTFEKQNKTFCATITQLGPIVDIPYHAGETDATVSFAVFSGQ